MKKLLLPISIVLLGCITAKAQTTGTDFTASDCSSTSHTLFTELNAGKVVVLVWVMPCGACISDAKAGYDAAQSFATSNPNKVLYWLVDDAGNTTCSSLSSWASTNAIGPTSSTVAFFGNSGNAISEANYGGTGMPHVVVMGGTDHHIYFNQKNGSGSGSAITTAINQAIAATTAGVGQVSSGNGAITLFPNPAKDQISVRYQLSQTSNVSIDVFNIQGERVQATSIANQPSGEQTTDLKFNGTLPNGVYSLRVSTNTESQTIRFTIAD